MNYKGKKNWSGIKYLIIVSQKWAYLVRNRQTGGIAHALRHAPDKQFKAYINAE